MRENLFKQTVRKLCFPPGAIRRIRMGPLRGMVFRVSDVTGLSPWYSGVEREHQRTFESLVQSGDTVIDIGANWGLHTLYLSKLAGPTGLVIAIEPFPPAFAELEWHMKANNRLNVCGIPDAISDVEGEALFAPGESASTGSLLESRRGASPQGEGLAIKTHTLDSISDEFAGRRLKLIKIDVEGAESNVLAGSAKTIERHRPYFVIDLHTPDQDIRVAHYLTSRRYTLSRLSGPPILRTNTGWPDRGGVWGTILAAPAT